MSSKFRELLRSMTITRATLSERWVSLLFLAAVLLADLVLIGLHILHKLATKTDIAWIGGPLDPSFDLETDGGYGECLMYFKEFVFIVVLIRMFIRFRQPVYACWAVLGGYLLLDDSLQLHERLALRLETRFELHELVAIPNTIGDFLVSCAFAVLLLSLVAFGYFRSDQASRQVSFGIVIFIAALGFVGVGVDAIHQFTNGTVRGMFALIEEGGELFVMTGLLSFLILTYGHQAGSTQVVPSVRLGDCRPCDPPTAA